MELVDLALPGLQGDQYQHLALNFIHKKIRKFSGVQSITNNQHSTGLSRMSIRFYHGRRWNGKDDKNIPSSLLI